MRNTQETINENSISKTAEKVNTKKTWETPELRTMTVPAKTQGGGPKNDQEDVFYTS